MKKFKGIRNKGFSLVELIIVVAIMVALIAVLAPSYVKYVQRSRDAVIESAAESVAETIKIEYTNQSFTASDCKLQLKKNNSGLLDLVLVDGTFSYEGVKDDLETLKIVCGIDKGKVVQSDKSFTLEISTATESITMSRTLDDIEINIEEVPETDDKS